MDKEFEALGGLLGCLDEGSLKHSLNLDGHAEFYSEEEDTEVGLAVTGFGAGDNGAGEQVRGGSHSGFINYASSGTKEPHPPDPPDTPSESDSDEEDAGYGSGVGSAVR